MRPRSLSLTAPEREHLARVANEPYGARITRATGWNHRVLTTLADRGLLRLEDRVTVARIGDTLFSSLRRFAQITDAGRDALARKGAAA